MLLTTTLLSAFAITATPDGTCQASKAAANTGNDIVETAVAAGSFNTLVTAVKAAGLVEALQGEGPFTVFAPTDEAFAKLPEGQLAQLLEPENKALLQAILTYHVVPTELDAKHVIASQNAATLNGQRIDFKTTDHGVTVDGARVLKTDISCSNGIIHVIDSVILPSTSDIIATAIEAGSFKTLAAALDAAELVTALQGDGPFTVFAPSDAAFAALPEGTVESLLKPENKDQLSSILKFHVVPGRVYSETVAAGHEFKTLLGHKITSSTDKKGVLIGSARVLQADIEATNGVIHVIDSVLLPE